MSIRRSQFHSHFQWLRAELHAIWMSSADLLLDGGLVKITNHSRSTEVERKSC